MSGKTILLLLPICGILILQCESKKIKDYGDLLNFASREITERSGIRQRIENTEKSGRSARINVVTTSLPQVITTSGLVTGARTVESNAFWEIPYAQPPVGDLRFQPPQKITTPYDHINGTTNNFLQCYQDERICVQISPEICVQNMKEDCLILNVFTPSSVDLTDSSNPPTDRLPVLFYIHGGFFTINSGTQPNVDGRELANVTNTVVVTINYRLGPFGFLMHQQTGEIDISGNQGLKDQQLALEWVQDNIEKFGGDKTRVTLFGNSAGAQSVMFHTLSNISRNLYTNAIQQSNPAAYSFLYPSPEQSLRITDRLILLLGCTGDERTCLMNSSAEHIINQTIAVQSMTSVDESNGLYASETYMPVIDGVEFENWPMELYRSGKWNSDKDMIIGVTTEEMDSDIYAIPANFNYTEQVFLGANMLALGNAEVAQMAVNKYKELYPLNPGEDYRKVYGKELTDYIFLCPNRLMARFASNTTSASVYYYVFDEKVLSHECDVSTGGNTTECYFADHASEVELVFRTFEEVRYEYYTERHLSVENQLSTYWGGFARTGNPSDGLLNPIGNFTSWPGYDFFSSTGQSWPYMYIRSPTSEVRHEFRKEICDFWDNLAFGGPFDFNFTDPAIETSTTETTSITATQSTTSHALRLDKNVKLIVITTLLIEIAFRRLGIL